MYLHALETAVPDAAYSQQTCWQILEQSQAARGLKERSLGLLRKILLGQNGIDQRHFAMPDIERVFDRSAEELNQAFEREAPALAGQALTRALQQADLKAADLDALFVCTCTGYLCPGVSSHLAEQLGLRPDAHLQDLVGLGCGAAIPTLRSASAFARAEPEARIAVVAVEVCSAAFYLDDDPGVLISLCLFGDGAASVIGSGTPGPDDLGRIDHFDTVHLPEDRELLRFENRQGKLRNRLDKTVPAVAARAVRHLFDRLPQPPETLVSHAGGRDVLDAIEAAIPGYPQAASRAVLRSHGNMSSPSVLFGLNRHLADNPPGADTWLTSFGAGFSAHSCRLVR
ncbi:MAG: type III polyketide synthase [Opitutales bacterium]